MKDYLKLIRIKHWLKNFLVFLPLFFSINLFKVELIYKCILAFFIFSLSSSIVYIINDLSDLEMDKLHSKKKERPLASGKISKKSAINAIAAIALLLTVLLIILYKIQKDIFIILIPLIYIMINILYSKALKMIPIIDVSVIVVGFILRVVYGGISINIEVSKYLYLMIVFGSYYLGFGKRRNEIIKNGDKSRKVLSMYNKSFLDKNMYVAFSLAIVSYTLWCVDPTTIARIGNDYIFWTIPLLMIILQLYSLNIEENSHGDPIDVILSDKKLLVISIIYLLVMGGIIYIL